ncbi:MAG: hypothetical protein KF773_26155 [Deltaproteobacteria bacterium]|nr:hypothetical protein [Deltaproteobacteria bacterium]
MAKTMRWIAAGALAAWWLWPSGGARVPATLQAAVLSDGYATIEDGRRIVTYDASGAVRETVAAALPPDTHVVGMVGGAGVVYRDGTQVVVGLLDDDGSVLDPHRFGRNVRKMCAQTATNQHRWAVMWVEHDGQLWIVRGPTRRGAAELVAEPTDDIRAQAAEDYCGVASAEDRTVMLWRGGGATFSAVCDAKRCGGAQRVKLDARHKIAGYGCTSDGCAIVTRSAAALQASWMWLRNGKIEWTRPLPSAAEGTRVTAAGAGKQVAIAYGIEPEPVVRVVDRTGAMKAVWQAPSETVPGLAWNGSALLVAAYRDGAVATSIVRP